MLAPFLLLASAGFFQTTEVAQGRAIAAMNPGAALVLFERALAHDSTSYEATWRAAIALVDLAESAPADSLTPPRRDSVHVEAVQYARRAIALSPDGADGHFALAVALGRTALTKGKRERARYAVEIYSEATRVTELDSTHDGAQHVLGAWNAEIMRLSGFSRFFARNLLGARVFGKASWEQAVSHLEASVRLDPTRIIHRLELARVYADRKRYADARRELAAIDGLTDKTVMDARYRLQARELSADVKQKQD
ncbi:MAG: hypothetical protein ABI647_05810 [Gemmatimonadota bacterium]